MLAYPQQDSNLRPRLRKPALCPLSYEGVVPDEGAAPSTSAVWRRRPSAAELTGHGACDRTRTGVFLADNEVLWPLSKQGPAVAGGSHGRVRPPA